ncbi:MAG: hypothetical protein RLZZ371_2116, partial [Pseudomonadota bacterium]
MKPIFSLGFFATVTALLFGCAVTSPAGVGIAAPTMPEGASGIHPKSGWATTKFAVAAAHPLATEAGHQILTLGGSAVDAAIAVQMVLGLVEPQSSGIGGGAFLIYFDGKTVQAFDGRETAPAAATEKLFLDAAGTPLAFFDAAVGGRSVGTPGLVRMLEMAHQAHGKLPWARLFDPAIRLAEEGFAVSPRLATLLQNEQHLHKDATAATFFYPNGQPLQAGTLLKNPAYAEVLRKIAREGARGLMEGSVAQAVVAKVNRHPTTPGNLALSDLAGYQAKKRDVFCSDYAAKSTTGAARDYRLCGMPPPSSGAITIAQILGMLSLTKAHTLAPEPGADFLHLYTEASRLAYADRAQYLGDPDFVQAPGGSWFSLIAPPYLTERAKLIDQATGAPSM